MENSKNPRVTLLYENNFISKGLNPMLCNPTPSVRVGTNEISLNFGSAGTSDLMFLPLQSNVQRGAQESTHTRNTTPDVEMQAIAALSDGP